jgi:hypothetical protein
VQGKGSIHAYVDAFRRVLARVPDMGESDRLFQFLRGLRPAIALQARMHGVTTLDAAIEIAVRVGSHIDQGSMPFHAAAAGQASGASHRSAAADAMELDAIEGLETETTDAPPSGDMRSALRQLLREELHAMGDARRGPTAYASSHGSSRGGNFRGLPRNLPRVPHLTPLQVKEFMDAGKCFGCGSKEHQSRQCPQRQPKEGERKDFH